MARKSKHKKNLILLRLRPEFVVVVLVVGALGLGMQARAQLTARHPTFAHEMAVQLAVAPTPKPATPTPAPAPASTPPPTATPAPRVAVVQRHPAPVPVVKPAPDSSVSNLVPVTIPSGETGMGGAASSSSGGPGASSSPTPTPSSAPTFAYSSSNWSGYLASAGSFSAINGGWAVPNVSGNGFSTSADATWIGIGGVTGSDLIQVGTDDTVTRSGQVSSIAFYEMLPAAETPVPGMTVTPGDTMSAALTQLGGMQWRISIADVTRGENFSTTVSYASTNSTAEWIEEDPSYSFGGLVPFDNFGNVSFSGATTVENGNTATLTGAGAQAIIMVNGHRQAVATPSSIFGNGEGFSVSGGG